MAGAERAYNIIFYLELGTRKGGEQPLPLRSARGTASPAELILHKDAIIGGKQLSSLGCLLLSEPKSKSIMSPTFLRLSYNNTVLAEGITVCFMPREGEVLYVVHPVQ